MEGQKDQQDRAPVAASAMPRVPEGEYDVICYDVETGRSWGGRENVYIKCRVFEGPCHDIELFLVCTYHPKAELTPRHKYYQQWTLAAGKPPSKGERLHFGVFKNKMFRVLVRNTQKRHRSGRIMADCVQYSVIDSIIEKVAG